MKIKFTLLSSLIFLFIHSLSCQSLLTIGTEWYYNYTKFDGPEISFNHCQIIGDTIIEGRDCLIFNRNKLSCDGRSKTDFIYEENKKVYFYETELQKFTLLYDYNAEVGEVLTMDFWHQFSFTQDTVYHVRIDSIDTYQYAGMDLKRFYVSYDIRDQDEIDFSSYSHLKGILIEGIGSLTNYFQLNDNGFCDATYNGPLRCFEHPDFGLIQFSEESCDFISSIDQVALSDDLVISPNPTSSIVRIATEELLEDATLLIFDSAGREVWRLEKKGTSKIDMTLDLSDLNGSFHVLHIFEQNNQHLVYTEKLIRLDKK